MEPPEQTIRRLRSAFGEKDDQLKKKNKTVDSLRMLQDMEDGLWDVTKESDRRVTDVPLLHTRVVVSDIPSDGGKLATVTSFGPTSPDTSAGRFVSGSEKCNDVPLFPGDGTPDPDNRAWTPEGRKVTACAVPGCPGTRETYSGILLMQPGKKKPGRRLTQGQKRYSRRVSRTRVRAGHAMGRIRRSGIPSRPYDGTPGQLGCEVQVATDLANFHVLWDRKNKKLRLGF